MLWHQQTARLELSGRRNSGAVENPSVTVRKQGELDREQMKDLSID